MPFLSDDNAGVELISEAIKEHCSALCCISQDYRKGQDGDLTMFRAIVNNTRRDSLGKIHLAQVDELQWPLLEGFQRHSHMLTTVTFEWSQQLCSKTIQGILFGCIALETLRLASGKYDSVRRNYQLDLEDAVAMPWGCTRIKFLKLAINLGGDLEGDSNGDLNWEMGRQAGNEDCMPTYVNAVLLKTLYSRELPIVLTESEQERMRLLQKLYRQLGSLSLLETLKIFVATTPDRGVNYCCCSFPGMLMLEDKKKGRPGFLDLLGGLRNLKKLVGSVSAYTKETRLAMGQTELEWMVDHWPKLERIALEPPGHPEFRGHGGCRSRSDNGFMHWLQSQRPNLKVQ